MEQILFYKTFYFGTIQIKSFHHTDNSNGIPCHFIARMRSGSCVIRALSGEELHLSAGDVFYLPMGLRYHSYWTPNNDQDGSVCWESYSFVHLPIKSEYRYTMQKINPTKVAMEWLDRLKEDQTVSLASVGYLYLFLSEVLPHFRIAVHDPKVSLLQSAFRYIERHEDFTVPELARACGISETGMYKLFRDYAHATPIEIKHRNVAKRAVLMLSTTDMTVETIASSLGLSSPAHLRKILKKQTGKVPQDIRKEAKFI